MDEQECIKSDVALACFVRAALRGLIASNAELLPHDVLVKDFNAVIKDGLNAEVSSPHGKTARQVCQHYLKLAMEHADEDEKKYLWLVKKRIEEGSLSELIRANVLRRARKQISIKQSLMFIQRLLSASPIINPTSKKRVKPRCLKTTKEQPTHMTYVVNAKLSVAKTLNHH